MPAFFRVAALLAAARDAASLHGWSTGRHKYSPTTDVPLWRLGGATAASVRAAIEEAVAVLRAEAGAPWIVTGDGLILTPAALRRLMGMP